MSSTRSSSALLHPFVSTALIMGAFTANAQSTSIAAGIDLPAKRVYALTSDNAIYVLKPGASQYVRLGRVNPSDGGNLIGIDFRPADNTPGKLYALTDKGGIYTVDLNGNTNLNSTKVSTTNPRFSGGFGALVDFNPVLNALRITGSNDQNLAVVNDANGGNLTTVAVQTALAYAAGDVNFGKNPEIVGGAYNNNYVGATATLFYLVDHDLDTLVTISTKNATGSSNTGGGQLQTIGPVVFPDGTPLNLSPTSDFDIYTDSSGKNFLVGQTTRWLFSIDLSQIDPNLPLGRTQKVIAKSGRAAPLPGSNAPLTGGVFDIAIATP